MIKRPLAALVMALSLSGECSAEPMTWTDLTGARRGGAQLEIDAAACDIMADQSSAGQPAAAGPNIGLTIANIGTQMILKQNFNEFRSLSKGWKQVPMSSIRPAQTQETQPPEQRASVAFATKDYASGLKLCLEAADENRPMGIWCVGSVYAKGLGVKQDFEEAMRWDRRAAETGDPQVMANFGGVYATGEFVKPDYAESMRSYRKAADKGNAEGQYGVGLILTNGWGLPKTSNKQCDGILRLQRRGTPAPKQTLGGFTKVALEYRSTSRKRAIGIVWLRLKENPMPKNCWSSLAEIE